MVFKFFDSAGWLILALVGFGYLYWAKLIKETRNEYVGPRWSMVISCSVVSCLFGIRLTVQSSSVIPSVVSQCGGNIDGCNAVIQTNLLIDFSSKYRVILICGVLDPTIDVLDDDRIIISSPFNILNGGVSIVAADVRHKDKLEKYRNRQLQIWHVPALIPFDLSTDKIATLGDVRKLGGKIVAPQYWE